MKVLLIIPKRYSGAILPALDIGIAYVARAVLNAGVDVEVLDAHKEDIGPDKLPNFLKTKPFNLIGIKCLSTDFFTVLEYCKVIKEHNQNIITVLGGPHPTALAEETMGYRDIDYIIRGEGELGLFSLIEKLIHYNNGEIPPQEMKQIPSLVYRDKSKNNKVQFNHIVLEENLDNLGFPAWHLFKIKEYPELPGSGGKFFPVLTSRGCPGHCTFCCTKIIHSGKVRIRSPENVIEEITWLIKNFTVKRISIFDDNFTFNKKHALKICDLLGKNFPLKFDIPQGIRIDMIDEELITVLEKTGCDYIGIGIESGDQKTLDIVSKGNTISNIQEKVNLIKNHTNIKLAGFFIIGFPHETEADILKTINFALKLKLDYATFTIFTPFPGTSLFSQMIEEGYFSIDTFNWEDLLLDRTTFDHRYIDNNRLKMLQRKAYFKFYFRPSKMKFFIRIIFRERSFKSYLIRFTSILRK